LQFFTLRVCPRLWRISSRAAAPENVKRRRTGKNRFRRTGKKAAPTGEFAFDYSSETDNYDSETDGGAES
jgi:hypothetical protein